MSKLTKYRMDLHQIPELGFEEFKTQQYILTQVEKLDCTIHTVKTGVILYFDAGKEKTISFRADMDGLPIKEETNLDFASTHEHTMHACGHDGHMAILLGLADWINENKAQLKTNVLLIFQPSEERDAGANAIIHSGYLEKYNVCAIFGLHLWPGKEKGTVWTRANEFMAAANELDINIQGRSVHVADSEQGIDALYIASQFLIDAYEMESALPEHVFRLLKFGEMHSGSVRNAISDETKIYGTLRSYNPEIHEHLQNELRKIADKYESKFGASIQISYKEGYDAVINDFDLVTQIKEIGQINELDKPVLQAEDFGLYRKVCPILFLFLGVGDTAPLHNEKFDFDMNVLDDGLDLFIRIIQTY